MRRDWRFKSSSLHEASCMPIRQSVFQERIPSTQLWTRVRAALPSNIDPGLINCRYMHPGLVFLLKPRRNIQRVDAMRCAIGSLYNHYIDFIRASMSRAVGLGGLVQVSRDWGGNYKRKENGDVEE